MKHVTVKKIKKYKHGEPFTLEIDKEQSGIFRAGYSPDDLKSLIVIALRQNDVESGKIAVVSLDGGFPCLMRVYRSNGQILLSRPKNLDFPNRTAETITLSEEEAAARLEILGKIVEIRYILSDGGAK